MHHVVDDDVGQLPRKVALAAVHGLDCVDELLRDRALDDVTRGAGLQRAVDVHRVGVHRQHDYARVQTTLAHEPGGFGAVQERHAMVHEHDVRLRIHRGTHRFAAV